MSDVFIAPRDVEDHADEVLPGEFQFLCLDLRSDKIINYLKEIGTPELGLEDITAQFRKKKIPLLFERLKDPLTSRDERIKILSEIKTGWEEGLIEDSKLRNTIVLTKSGKWLAPGRVLFSSEYEPDENVERLIRGGLLDWKELEFLDPMFIRGLTREEMIKWREFFQKAMVGEDFLNRKERATERVGVLASLRYETEKCGLSRNDIHVLEESEARGKGYDIESEMADGSPKYIEAKGRSGAEPMISLTRSEHRFISLNPERAFVYAVTNALRDPEIHIVGGKSLDEKDLLYRVELSLIWSEFARAIIDRWKALS